VDFRIHGYKINCHLSPQEGLDDPENHEIEAHGNGDHQSIDLEIAEKIRINIGGAENSFNDEELRLHLTVIAEIYGPPTTQWSKSLKYVHKINDLASAKN
jgi:hypothetical protein